MRKTKAAKLTEQITTLKEELKVHQGRCKHPRNHVYYLLQGDSGNWCPQDDAYWTVCFCRLCLRTWVIDNQYFREGTRVYSNKRLRSDED